MPSQFTLQDFEEAPASQFTLSDFEEEPELRQAVTPPDLGPVPFEMGAVNAPPEFRATTAPTAPPTAVAPPDIELSPYQKADLASMMAGRGKAETGMEAGTEFTTALGGAAIRGVGQAVDYLDRALTPQQVLPPPELDPETAALAEEFRKIRQRIGVGRKSFKEWAMTPAVNLRPDFLRVNADDPIWVAAVKEIDNLLLSIPEFATAPFGGLAMAAAPVPGGPMAVRGAFALDIAKSMFEQAPALYENWSKLSPAERTKGIVDFVGSGALFGALARYKPKAEIERTVPEGVLPPADIPFGLLQPGRTGRGFRTERGVVTSVGVEPPPSVEVPSSVVGPVIPTRTPAPPGYLKTKAQLAAEAVAAGAVAKAATPANIATRLEASLRNPEELKTGNALSSRLGLEVKSIEDLENLAKLHEKIAEENRKLMEELRSLPPEERAKRSLEIGSASLRGQLVRETAGVATDTAWIEGEGTIPTRLGPRPLDWKTNPEVADWMLKNANRLELKLPDELKARAKPPEPVIEDKRLYVPAIRLPSGEVIEAAIGEGHGELRALYPEIKSSDITSGFRSRKTGKFLNMLEAVRENKALKPPEPAPAAPKPTSAIPKREVGKSFSKLVENNRNDLEAVLDNWNGSELSEDGERIFFRDTRGGGGKIHYTKSEFFDWLFSDKPFDAKEMVVDDEWRAMIGRLRESAQGKKVAPPPPTPPTPTAKQPWEITRGDYVGEGYIYSGKTTDLALRRQVSEWQKRYDQTQSDGAKQGLERANRKLVLAGEHRATVEQALAEGKPVPPEVLADYPDLAKPTPAPAAEKKGKPFEVDEQLVMRSPHTGEDTIVNFRGLLPNGQAVVWTGKSQFPVPKEWLRRQGEAYEGQVPTETTVTPKPTEVPPKDKTGKPVGEPGGPKTHTYLGYTIESTPQATQVGYSTATKLFGKGRRLGGFEVIQPDGYRRHFDTLKAAKQWIDQNPIEPPPPPGTQGLAKAVKDMTPYEALQEYQDIATEDSQLIRTKSALAAQMLADKNSTSKAGKARYAKAQQEWDAATKRRNELELRRKEIQWKAQQYKGPPIPPREPTGPDKGIGGAAIRGRKWTDATDPNSEKAFVGLHILEPLFRPLVERTSPYVKAVVDTIMAVGKHQFDIGKATDFRRSILHWSAKLQRSFGEAGAAQKEIRVKVPDKTRREGITNWIQAAGDRTVLAQRRADTAAWRDPVTGKPHPQQKQLLAGYDAALNLTPDEIAVAQDAKRTYDELGNRGQTYDVLKTFKDNYVTQIWNLRRGPIPRGAGVGRSLMLKDRFRFAKASTFPTYFDGEQAGYIPKTKDIADILPMYMHEMNSVIAARQLVEQMGGGVGSDGRPLLAPRGIGAAVDDARGKATLVMPDVPAEKTRDYVIIENQPALHEWRWVTKDAAGNPVFNKSDLMVHPEVADHFRNVLGRSAIKEWYRSRTTASAEIPKLIARGLDFAQSETKRTMLGVLTPFHQVQEATHAIGHRVNPFFNNPKIDLVNDVGQMDAAQHGLMLLPDRTSAQQFMEGFKQSAIVTKIPVLGPLADHYSEYLFHQYIPGIKYKTYQAILQRNTHVYGKELKTGKATVEDIKILSAEQANAAYGHLNYADLGRNPTILHIMRLGLLAPDFLEARARFAGQAIKGVTGQKIGREQLVALATLALAQASLSYIMANITGGVWDEKDPFAFHVGNKKFTMRSVPEDTYRFLKDTRSFVYARLNPIIGRGAVQYASGVDWRGQKVTKTRTTKELLSQPVPLFLRPLVGLGNTPLEAWEEIAAASGLKISRYSAVAEMYKIAHQWKAHHPDQKVQRAEARYEASSFPDSDYKPLRESLIKNDMKGALTAYEELLKTGHPHKDIDNVMKPWTGGTVNKATGELTPRHPKAFTSAKLESQFVNSLTDEQRATYNRAVVERRELYGRFQTMLSQQQPKPKPTSQFSLKDFE